MNAETAQIVLSLGIVVLAGVLGGLVASRLRQPVILGYLLAGALVGPPGLGLVDEKGVIAGLAELGVALLMFTLGAQLSLDELGQVRWVAIFGGIIQVVGTIVLGAGLGLLLGMSFQASLFLGAIVAISSTAVALKVLGERGEQGTIKGHILVGFLLIQDLSVVPMMVILPALARPENLIFVLPLAILKAVVILVGVYVVGRRALPWILYRVAAFRSRELFLLSVVGLVFGTAIGFSYAGLSLALGAFLAGILFSESDFAPQALGEVIPLRDLFAALFFVSIGMLADPRYLFSHPETVFGMLAVVIIGKTLIGIAAVKVFGYSLSVALAVGLGLAQVGEFSFILANLAVSSGIATDELQTLTASVATFSIIFSPLLLSKSGSFAVQLARLPVVGMLFAEPALAYLDEQSTTPVVGTEPRERLEERGHAVICGYGAAGHALADVLRSRGFNSYIVDYDPRVIAEARANGYPCVYGDAGNQGVLEKTSLKHAIVLALLVPDRLAIERAARFAQEQNPRLEIIARVAEVSVKDKGSLAGIDEVVDPNFEGGLEVIRHSLVRFGVSRNEAAYIISRLRQRHLQG